jgi:hypothetical protein
MVLSGVGGTLAIQLFTALMFKFVLGEEDDDED